MSAAQERAKSIFLNAAEIASEEQRRAYIEAQCAGDESLRQEVEQLLEHQSPAAGFLENAAVAVTADMTTPGSVRLSERPGMKIGRYKLLQQIGEGGFGVVFMAEQEQPVRRLVALKIIKLGMDTRQVVARFEAERQALAVMDHPNVAKVLDGGATETGRPYFVMELVKGTPITEYCDKHNLNIPDRLELFAQVCQAVQHAHQKGLIHRDIKPSNILVSTQDDRPMAKVIDFGIAKAMQSRLTEKTLFTEFRQFVGTPEYMSPEQAEGNHDVDTRSDVYSLGVLLYELLSGSPPFDPKDLRSKAFAEMQRIIREVEPLSPSTRLTTMKDTLPSVAAHRGIEPRKLAALLHGELDWIVMRAMAKDRTRRYQTASALGADLARYLRREPVEAVPPSAWYKARKLVHRHRAKVAAAALVFFVIIAGAVASGIGFFRAARAEHVTRQQRDIATQQRDKAQQAQTEADAQRRAAELRLAEGLVSQGDALTSAGEFQSAYSRFAEAEAALQKLDPGGGARLAHLDLSLVRLYRASPPPLWNVSIPGGVPRAWVVLPSRNEVIAACADDRFHVFDLITGGELRVIGDARGVRCMAVANLAEGPVVVAAGTTFVRVIDPSIGAIVRQAQDNRASDFCVISPNGLLAASGAGDGDVTFWETATLKKLGTGTHGPRALSAAFSHDGATVATVSEEDSLALWDPGTGKQIRRLNISRCVRVAFSADDRALLCAELNGVVRMLSLDGNPLAAWPAHNWGCTTSLTVTPEGNRVITAGLDSRVRVFDNSFSGVWDATLTLVAESTSFVGAVYVAGTGPKPCAATSGLALPDQGVVVAVSGRGNLVAWPLVAPVRLNQRMDGGMSMSPDGQLYAGESHGRIELCDTATGRTLRIFQRPAYSNATAFSPDGRRLFVGSVDATLQAFDLLHDKCEWSVRGNDMIWSIGVSPDGSIVASGVNRKGPRIWDAETGSLLRVLRPTGGDRSIAFLPDDAPHLGASPGMAAPWRGPRLLMRGSDAYGLVTISDLGGDAPPRAISVPRGVRGFTFSPDRKLLAVATVGYADLLDAATLRSTGILGPVRSVVYQLQFIDPGSGPGTWAVTCGGRELRVWDLTTRQERLVLCSIPPYTTSSTLRDTVFNINTLLGSPDGTVLIAKGAGRIDLTLPRRYRELQRSASPVARAEWYALWGLWAWTRELLVREHASGREVPALLLARADWMCGEYEAARSAFDLAVARGEATRQYAELCLSVGDTPVTITSREPAPASLDPAEDTLAAEPIPDGILPAAEIPALKTMFGREVIVEGVVAASFWVQSGDTMCILFAGDEQSVMGLTCTVAGANRAKFDTAFGGDAAATFWGARLRLRGNLDANTGSDTYELKGLPQIVLDDPRQVTIVQKRPAHGELPVPMSAVGKRAQEAEVCFRRATAHLDARRYAEAVADFSRVIEQRPDHQVAWRERGRAWMFLGQYEKAVVDEVRAVALDPRDVWAWFQRGWAYKGLRQYETAVADFSKAIELQPDIAQLWFARSDCWAAMRQPDKAGEDFAKAIALLGKDLQSKPNDAQTHNHLAWILATVANPKFRDPRRAVELAEKGVQLAPTDGNIWNTLGIAHYRAGDFKQAVSDLEKSIQLRSGGSSFDFFFLAMAHHQLGHPDEARKWHDQAIEWMDKSAPKDPQLRRFRAEAAQLLGIPEPKPATAPATQP